MESKYIIANGIRIHYQEAGNGPLVILLHGFPEFWYGWKHQIPALSQQFRVVAPDMRGYNLSDKPSLVSDYKIETLAKDIADLVVALGEDKAYIVGHDWGAAVAWAVAGLHPEVVKKLVILNVPHPGEMKRAFLSFNFAQWSKSWYIFFFFGDCFTICEFPKSFIVSAINSHLYRIPCTSCIGYLSAKGLNAHSGVYLIAQ